MKHLSAILASLLLTTSSTLLAQRISAPHGVRSVPIAGPTNYIPQPFDVLHYEVDLDLTKAPERLTKGLCSITILWREAPTSGPFRFHLRDLSVSETRYDGAPLSVTAVGDPTSETYHYEVTAPPGAETGDTAVITIRYEGTMTDEYGSGTWGGVSSSEGMLYAMGVGFKNNYVSSTQHWLPCYDHPSDKATFKGRFKVAKDMVVASNGLVTISEEGENTIYEWRHNYPCATYLYTFAVAPLKVLEFGDGTLPMVVYTPPQDTAMTRQSFKLLPRMVQALADRFGPYPFEKVGYVTTPQGSMEHETMVSFAASIARNGDSINPTAAHELAHQWFGDMVSPRDFRDAWLNESFATYCEAVWAEDLGGRPGYLRALETMRVSYINQISAAEGVFPLYDFPRASPSSNYPATIYYKGAVVVGMLRYELGDSIFFAAMRDYLTRYSYGVTTTDSLKAILEAHAGTSLGWFFDQWVNRGGWPILDVSVATEPTNDTLNRVRLRIRQRQPQEFGLYTNVPVEVGFRSSKGGITYRLVTLTGEEQTFELESVPDFTNITLNQGPTLRALLASGKISGAPDNIGSGNSDGPAFTVSPTPVTAGSPLRISVADPDECSKIRYELFDTTGSRVADGKGDSCEFTISTDRLPSGEYMLRVGRGATTQDVQIMIIR